VRQDAQISVFKKEALKYSCPYVRAFFLRYAVKCIFEHILFLHTKATKKVPHYAAEEKKGQKSPLFSNYYNSFSLQIFFLGSLSVKNRYGAEVSKFKRRLRELFPVF
jgi:hypothetical protein